jgi:hypothetical protein
MVVDTSGRGREAPKAPKWRGPEYPNSSAKVILMSKAIKISYPSVFKFKTPNLEVLEGKPCARCKHYDPERLKCDKIPVFKPTAESMSSTDLWHLHTASDGPYCDMFEEFRLNPIELTRRCR